MAFFLWRSYKKNIQPEMSFIVVKELIDATKENDLEKVKKAVESGRVSPNARLQTNQPWLCLPAYVCFLLFLLIFHFHLICFFLKIFSFIEWTL